MRTYLVIIFFIFLSSCSSTPKPLNTDNLIELKQLTPLVVKTNTYSIMTLAPLKSANTKMLRIYIEGDGKAWMRSGRPSLNPTPVNRLVHKIMLEDSYKDIAYIARPCQFISSSECSSYTWTFGRYDQKTLEAMDTALTNIKHRGNYEQVELIGYSGGATIALLLASKRNDVINVRTIAGNLDPDFTNDFHKVSPMPTALNPSDHSDRLSKVPQIHFYGSKDSVIPQAISNHFKKQLNDSFCFQAKSVNDANHHSGWTEHWQSLLREKPECKKAHN